MSSLAIQQFRDKYRSKYPKNYSGVLHFGLTNFICMVLVGMAVFMMKQPLFVEWIVVPLTFLLANFLEYWAHRFLMHRRNNLFVAAFDRHMNHHRFYSHEAMYGEFTQDFRITLFPISLILGITCLFIIPLTGLLALIVSQNVAALFLLTATLYLLNYEWLHLFYHLPENKWTAWWLLRKLRQHHLKHHDPKLMQKYHFNISYPLIDFIVGDLAIKSEQNNHAAVTPKMEETDYYFNESGLMVFTRSYHLKRGYCCESGCRHCPY